MKCVKKSEINNVVCIFLFILVGNISVLGAVVYDLLNVLPLQLTAGLSSLE